MCSGAFGQTKTISDQASIDKLLASIPVNNIAMPHKTLVERLDSLGVSVNGVSYGTVTADEVEIDPDHIKRGDVLYQFTTTTPSPRAQEKCKFQNNFTLVKRKGRWLVQDRTSNYLLQNQCQIPN
ncbi:hypothetical protein GCM10027195_30670 [Comamonas sediminis]